MLASHWRDLQLSLSLPKSSLKIGLFGLTDLTGIFLSPFAGYLVDHISPWVALLISCTALALFETIEVATGGKILAALIVRCIGIDILRQLQYIALSAYIYTCVRRLPSGFGTSERSPRLFSAGCR